MNNIIKKITSLVVICTFSMSMMLPPNAYAQSYMPQPGTMVNLSPEYMPIIMRGIKVFLDNPLKFDFIIDKGEFVVNGRDRSLHDESIKLIKYFLTTLTIPEDDLWVNLSPYEKDRIVPNQFGITEMGKDLLAQDYLLKQITSSLMYPEKELGQEFWDKVYEKAFKEYGTTDIPVDTFNKVWIVPEKAVVYENGDTAFVAESKLKVMLEEDYVAQRNNNNDIVGVDFHVHPKNIVENQKISGRHGSLPLQDFSSDIIRQIIIPAIEKEVNEGKNFATLRQIYNSMILATWYKRTLRESIFGKVYIGKNKVAGVDVEDKEIKQKIYDQYIESFKKGAYNYIKEEFDPKTQQIIPRKYFSGGVDAIDIDSAMVVTNNKTSVINKFKNPSNFIILSSNIMPANDQAMISFQDSKEKLINIFRRNSHEFDIKKSIALEDYVSYRKLFKSKGTDDEDIINVLDDPKEMKRRVEGSFRSKRPAKIEFLITRQASSIVQSVLELVSNASDAITGRTSPIGRFGMGALQMLAFVLDEKNPALDRGAHIIVETATKDGEGRRIVFFKGKDNRVYFNVDKVAKDHGTSIRIQFLKGMKESLKESIEEHLKDKLHLFTKMPVVMNNELLNHFVGYQYLNGDEVGYDQEKQISITVSDNEIIVDDKGEGMSDEVIFDKYLIPRMGENQPTPEKQSEDKIKKDVHIFYKDSQFKEKEQQSKIVFQVSGVNIQEFTREGYDLPEEMVVQLPSSTLLTVSRDGIEIDETTHSAVKALAEKIIDSKLSEKDKISMINGFMQSVRLLDEKNRRTSVYQSLVDSAKEVFIPYLRELNKPVLPNDREYRQVISSDETVFLDQKLVYKISPEQIPGAERLKAFKPGTFKKAFVVPFKKSSNLTYLPLGPYLLLNKKIYDKFKDSPVLLNFRLNFYVGYGKRAPSKGRILTIQEAEDLEEASVIPLLKGYEELTKILSPKDAEVLQSYFTKHPQEKDRLNTLLSVMNDFAKTIPEDMRDQISWENILPLGTNHEEVFDQILAAPNTILFPDIEFLILHKDYFLNQDHPDRIKRYLSNLFVANGIIRYSSSPVFHHVISQIDKKALPYLDMEVFNKVSELFENKDLESYEEAFKAINDGLPYVNGDGIKRLILRWIRIYKNDPKAANVFYEKLKQKHGREQKIKETQAIKNQNDVLVNIEGLSNEHHLALPESNMNRKDFLGDLGINLEGGERVFAFKREGGNISLMKVNPSTSAVDPNEGNVFTSDSLLKNIMWTGLRDENGRYILLCYEDVPSKFDYNKFFTFAYDAKTNKTKEIDRTTVWEFDPQEILELGIRKNNVASLIAIQDSSKGIKLSVDSSGKIKKIGKEFYVLPNEVAKAYSFQNATDRKSNKETFIVDRENDIEYVEFPSNNTSKNERTMIRKKEVGAEKESLHVIKEGEKIFFVQMGVDYILNLFEYRNGKLRFVDNDDDYGLVQGTGKMFEMEGLETEDGNRVFAIGDRIGNVVLFSVNTKDKKIKKIKDFHLRENFTIPSDGGEIQKIEYDKKMKRILITTKWNVLTLNLSGNLKSSAAEDMTPAQAFERKVIDKTKFPESATRVKRIGQDISELPFAFASNTGIRIEGKPVICTYDADGDVINFNLYDPESKHKDLFGKTIAHLNAGSYGSIEEVRWTGKKDKHGRYVVGVLEKNSTLAFYSIDLEDGDLDYQNRRFQKFESPDIDWIYEKAIPIDINDPDKVLYAVVKQKSVDFFTYNVTENTLSNSFNHKVPGPRNPVDVIDPGIEINNKKLLYIKEKFVSVPVLYDIAKNEVEEITLFELQKRVQAEPNMAAIKNNNGKTMIVSVSKYGYVRVFNFDDHFANREDARAEVFSQIENNMLPGFPNAGDMEYDYLTKLDGLKDDKGNQLLLAGSSQTPFVAIFSIDSETGRVKGLKGYNLKDFSKEESTNLNLSVNADPVSFNKNDNIIWIDTNKGVFALDLNDAIDVKRGMAISGGEKEGKVSKDKQMIFKPELLNIDKVNQVDETRIPGKFLGKRKYFGLSIDGNPIYVVVNQDSTSFDFYQIDKSSGEATKVGDYVKEGIEELTKDNPSADTVREEHQPENIEFVGINEKNEAVFIAIYKNNTIDTVSFNLETKETRRLKRIWSSIGRKDPDFRLIKVNDPIKKENMFKIIFGKTSFFVKVDLNTGEILDVKNNEYIQNILLPLSSKKPFDSISGHREAQKDTVSMFVGKEEEDFTKHFLTNYIIDNVWKGNVVPIERTDNYIKFITHNSAAYFVTFIYDLSTMKIKILNDDLIAPSIKFFLLDNVQDSKGNQMFAAGGGVTGSLSFFGFDKENNKIYKIKEMDLNDYIEQKPFTDFPMVSDSFGETKSFLPLTIKGINNVKVDADNNILIVSTLEGIFYVNLSDDVISKAPLDDGKSKYIDGVWVPSARRNGFEALDERDDDLSGFPSTERNIIRFLKEEDVEFIEEEDLDERNPEWQVENDLPEGEELPLSFMNYLYEMYAAEIEDNEDISFEDLLLYVQQEKGVNLENYKNTIRSAIAGQDKTQRSWVRELIQNARDAIRKEREKGNLGPEEGNIQIRNFTNNGDWVFSIRDFGGMNLYDIIRFYFPLDQSSKDYLTDTGNLGQGNYTLFSDFDRVLIRTSKGDGVIQEIEIEKDKEKGPVIRKWTQMKGEYKGTEIRRIKKVDTSDPQLESLFIQDAMENFAGAIQSPEKMKEKGLTPRLRDMEILYNGEEFSGDIDFISGSDIGDGWGEVSIGRTKEKYRKRVIQDEIYIKDPDVKELKYVPSWLLKDFERFGGLHISIPKNIQLNIPRTGYSQEDKFLNRLQIAVLHNMMKAVLSDFGDGKASIHGFPADYYSNVYTYDKRSAQDIAELMLKGKYDKIDGQMLEPYLSSPVRFFELMSHIPFLSSQTEGETTLHEIRETFLREQRELMLEKRREVSPNKQRSVKEIFKGKAPGGDFGFYLKEAAGTEVFHGGEMGGLIEMMERSRSEEKKRNVDEILPKEEKLLFDYLSRRILSPIVQEDMPPLNYIYHESHAQASTLGGRYIEWNLFYMKDYIDAIYKASQDNEQLKRMLQYDGQAFERILNVIIHESQHLRKFEQPGDHTHHDDEEADDGFAKRMGEAIDKVLHDIESFETELTQPEEKMQSFIEKVSGKNKGLKRKFNFVLQASTKDEAMMSDEKFMDMLVDKITGMSVVAKKSGQVYKLKAKVHSYDHKKIHVYLQKGSMERDIMNFIVHDNSIMESLISLKGVSFGYSEETLEGQGIAKQIYNLLIDALPYGAVRIYSIIDKETKMKIFEDYNVDQTGNVIRKTDGKIVVDSSPGENEISLLDVLLNTPMGNIALNKPEVSSSFDLEYYASNSQLYKNVEALKMLLLEAKDGMVPSFDIYAIKTKVDKDNAMAADELDKEKGIIFQYANRVNVIANPASDLGDLAEAIKVAKGLKRRDRSLDVRVVVLKNWDKVKIFTKDLVGEDAQIEFLDATSLDKQRKLVDEIQADVNIYAGYTNMYDEDYKHKGTYIKRAPINIFLEEYDNPSTIELKDKINKDDDGNVFIYLPSGLSQDVNGLYLESIHGEETYSKADILSNIFENMVIRNDDVGTEELSEKLKDAVWYGFYSHQSYPVNYALKSMLYAQETDENFAGKTKVVFLQGHNAPIRDPNINFYDFDNQDGLFKVPERSKDNNIFVINIPSGFWPQVEKHSDIIIASGDNTPTERLATAKDDASQNRKFFYEIRGHKGLFAEAMLKAALDVMSPDERKEYEDLFRFIFIDSKNMEGIKDKLDESILRSLSRMYTDPKVNEIFQRMSGELLRKGDIVNEVVKVIQDNEGSYKDSFVKDHAMTAPGGIDLNPNKLELETKGKGLDFDLPNVTLEELENASGFVPIIIQITPVTNINMLLGEADLEEVPQEHS